MTKDELEAGADAVEKIAKDNHVSFYFNRDHYREIAARVIEAYEAKRTAVRVAEAKPGR